MSPTKTNGEMLTICNEQKFISSPTSTRIQQSFGTQEHHKECKARTTTPSVHYAKEFPPPPCPMHHLKKTVHFYFKVSFCDGGEYACNFEGSTSRCGVRRLNREEKSDLYIVREDLKIKKQYDGTEKENLFVVLDAIREGEDTVAELMLYGDIDLSVKDKEGMSAFHLAAMYNAIEDFELLSLHDADHWNVDETDLEGQTALHLAAFHGHDEMVQMCLNRNYNPRLETKDWLTPMDMAAQNHEWACVKVLAKHLSRDRIKEKSIVDLELDLHSLFA